MKKILLVISLLYSVLAFAQQTAIPDPNFEQALIDLGYDTGTPDGFVPTVNIDPITFLDITDKGIEELIGIEAMKSLRDLRCGDNNIKDVDFSENTALISLSIALNPLNDLDVSANTNLERLNYSFNNLNNVDLSSNINLKVLVCVRNGLTNLDLSNNLKLEELTCSNNSLTTLDLSAHENLVFLDCENNNLSSLDVQNTNNTNINGIRGRNNPNLLCVNVDDALFSQVLWFSNFDVQTNFSENCSSLVYAFVPDDAFEQALIDMGYDTGVRDNYVEVTETGLDKLDSLNVSNLNIADLTGIEYFTALNNLVCRGNQLTSINVSQNNLLTRLYCDSNQLTALDVANNTSLEYLDCSINQLTSLDLNVNSNLIGLVCIENELTNLTIKNGKNTNITTFFASSNPNLNCIEVDNEAYSVANWTDIDPQTRFSEDCNAPMDLTFVPDDNFEQALIDLGYDSGPLDDFVLTSNISAVTNLDIRNRGIADLTGIEDFNALTDLICIANQLTTLDVSSNINLSLLSFASNQISTIDVSQNINLTNFNGNNNELSSLDVSANSALLTLSCSGNQLSSINLSQNILLRDFRFHNNQLTELDLSENPQIVNLGANDNQLVTLNLDQNINLEDFDCMGNPLTSLSVKNGNNTIIEDFNITNSPNLTCVTVDDAAYSTANWTTIDSQTSFSEDCSVAAVMTFVPDDNFEQALIDLGYDSGPLDDFVPTNNINTVTTLDVNNKSISDLTGIEAFIALTDLVCRSNQLVELDVSSNTALTRILCEGNQITNLNLGQNTALRILLASDNQLTTLDVSQNTALESLTCSDNQLTGIDLTQNNSLITLSCFRNQISSLNLSQNTALESLAAFRNELSDIDLSQNIDLTNLQLDNNQLTALAVPQNINIESLSVGSNLLTSIDLSQNEALSVLTCSSNQLETLDLSFNTKLIFLQCAANQLTGLNVQNGNNLNVTSFNAINNPDLDCIQVDDVAYSTANWTDIDPQTSFSEDCNSTVAQTFVPDDNFEQALIDLGYDSGPLDDFVPTANINTLTSLDVSGLGIADLTGIEDFTALSTLFCGSNNLSSINIGSNINLTELHIPSNQITTLDSTLNGALVHINCDNNQLSSLDVSNNGDLRILSCSGNQLTGLELTENADLRILLCNENQLSSLDLSENNQLVMLSCFSNQLTSMDIRNGGNTNTTNFVTTGNPDLNCIQVDDVAYSEVNWTEIDPQTSFSEDCTDTTAPVITLSGANPQVIELGEGYTELGATTDDGNVVEIDASAFMDALGSYTIFYNATDANGNTAEEVTRTVNVVETDTTAPVITLNGANPQIIELGEGYTELGATTDDGSTVTIDASEFMDLVGSYTIYYNSTDSNGNVALEVTRTVEVIDRNATVEVSNGFSPNGDAIADTWVIENLQNYPNHMVVVYNRWGNKVFEAQDYRNNWEGTSQTSSSRKLPVGPYLYVIQFNDSETKPLQGWVYINY